MACTLPAHRDPLAAAVALILTMKYKLDRLMGAALLENSANLVSTSVHGRIGGFSVGLRLPDTGALMYQAVHGCCIVDLCVFR